jgi:hypothetical protein
VSALFVDDRDGGFVGFDDVFHIPMARKMCEVMSGVASFSKLRMRAARRPSGRGWIVAVDQVWTTPG